MNEQVTQETDCSCSCCEREVQSGEGERIIRSVSDVFLLRYRSSQSLSPSTVWTYHNLIPICTIILAYLYLGEPLCVRTIVGGTMVVAAAELVRRTNETF